MWEAATTATPADSAHRFIGASSHGHLTTFSPNWASHLKGDTFQKQTWPCLPPLLQSSLSWLMSNRAFRLLKTKWPQFFSPILHVQVTLFLPSKEMWNQMTWYHFYGLWSVVCVSPPTLHPVGSPGRFFPGSSLLVSTAQLV